MFFVYCVFILYALISVLFFFLFVSEIGCGLQLWHSLNYSINVFDNWASEAGKSVLPSSKVKR